MNGGHVWTEVSRIDMVDAGVRRTKLGTILSVTDRRQLPVICSRLEIQNSYNQLSLLEKENSLLSTSHIEISAFLNVNL